jgi:transcriptional regulator with XRE-family HTH domain
VLIRQMNISHDLTRLRDRRDAQGVSLRALKTRSGVAVATLARIEADTGMPLA